MEQVVELQVCDAYEGGVPVSQIANEFSITKQSVYETLRKYKIGLRPGRNTNSKIELWEDEVTNEFVSDYQNGMKVSEILNKYDIAGPTLYKILDRLGIPTRTASPSEIAARDRRMDHAIKLYMEGQPVYIIEDETGISSAMLYKELYHRGVRLRNARRPRAPITPFKG